MVYFGKIELYDSAKGAGTIAPDRGGEVLEFNKADLQQMGEEPKVNERFGYETNEGDGGTKRAVKLQRQQTEDQIRMEQARNQRG